MTATGCGSPPERGEPAPAARGGASLAVTDLAGSKHDIDAALARGETVALVFWQTWCKPCRHEAPALAAAHERHGDAIRFIGVVSGEQDPAEIAETARAWRIPYPQVIDADLALTSRFAVRGTPTIIVLGAGERQLYRGHRAPDDWAALRGARGAR